MKSTGALSSNKLQWFDLKTGYHDRGPTNCHQCVTPHWPKRDKLQWNCNWSKNIFIQQYSCEYTFCHWWLCLFKFHWVSTLNPDHHLADDIFKCIFLNENIWILIWISVKFVPMDSIDNKSALVQMWSHWLNQYILMTQISDLYMRHQASMSYT